MRIAVIGKGTSSIITTLCLLRDGHSVEIYYDPDTPYLSVGESTTPQIGVLINSVLDKTILQMELDGVVSVKYGTKFIDWGIGKDWHHDIALSNNIAFQFETSEFNPYLHNILADNGVKYIPHRVENYKNDGDFIDIDGEIYDFIIECSGWSDESEYQKPIFETVNSAVTYKQNSIDVDKSYSIHRATEDGWQFELPFLRKGITKCGYLFDRNKINTESVIEKLSDYKIENTIEWTPQFAKKIIQNKNCAYNGNKLFFHEPLEALSLQYYFVFADSICQYLRDRTLETYSLANHSYHHEIWSYQMILASHYKYGSIYNTPFWEEKVKQSKSVMNIPLGDLDNLLENVVLDKALHNQNIFTELSKIGCYDVNDYIQIHCGMTGQSWEDILNTYKIEW